jgi:pyridoxal phosphate enzyme (YggS family)
VGHLQSNKARRAAELFDVVHSLDSVRTAGRLCQTCRDLDKSLSVLVQVDLGREKTKFGVLPDEVLPLVAAISGMEGLKLNGLMTLPPFFDDPERARPYFRQLRELRDRLELQEPGCLGLQHLSMGMSNDFEVAISEGATIVRVGTAIFGERHVV